MEYCNSSVSSDGSAQSLFRYELPINVLSRNVSYGVEEHSIVSPGEILENVHETEESSWTPAKYDSIRDAGQSPSYFMVIVVFRNSNKKSVDITSDSTSNRMKSVKFRKVHLEPPRHLLQHRWPTNINQKAAAFHQYSRCPLPFSFLSHSQWTRSRNRIGSRIPRFALRTEKHKTAEIKKRKEKEKLILLHFLMFLNSDNDDDS